MINLGILKAAGRLQSLVRITALGILTVCLWSGEADAAEGWQTDFKAAEAQAKADQVPIVIHFHASWCGPCRRMESEVLSTAQVRELLGKGIIGVKVDSDRNRDLVSRFGVTALPTDVIISHDGKVLAKDVGSPGLSGYVSRLRQHMRPAATAAEAAPAVAKSEPAPANPVPAIPAAPEAPAKPAEAAQPEVPAPATATSEPAAAADALAAELRDAVRLIQRRNGARIGLGGFSPVAYAEKQNWVEGSAEFSSTYQGVDYLLSSATERDQFKAAPEKFAPALHGCDPVLLTRDRQVQVGLIGLRVEHDSRSYFFATSETREVFLRDPAKFTASRSLVFFQAEERKNPS